MACTPSPFHTIFCILCHSNRPLTVSWCTLHVFEQLAMRTIDMNIWCFDRMKYVWVFYCRHWMGKWARTWEIDHYRCINSPSYYIFPRFKSFISRKKYEKNQLFYSSTDFHSPNDITQFTRIGAVRDRQLTMCNSISSRTFSRISYVCATNHNKNRWMTFNLP